MNFSVDLNIGDRVLTDAGPARVKSMWALGVELETINEPAKLVPWTDLIIRPTIDGQAQAVDAALHPWWDQLPEKVQQDAIFKMECVLEILTGFRSGLASLAQPHEPVVPFGPFSQASVSAQCEAMARLVSFEKSADRELMRRVQDGELDSPGVTPRAVHHWVRRWQASGLRGLVDGRALRSAQGFGALDPRFLKIAEQEFARFDGSASATNRQEIHRRIQVRMHAEGITDAHLPQRLVSDYLSHRFAQLGKTTRAHRSRRHRKISSTASAALHHLGHCATDVTRADNLVYDEFTGKPMSVEIATIMSVPARVIVAVRVFPKSVSATEVALLLYDAMRPQSMLIDQDGASDWRWCGVPTSLQLPEQASPLANDPASGLGEHAIPAMTPTHLRMDNGSIFRSEQLRRLALHWSITLSHSRGTRPTDNPHIERFHETLQRFYQQLPGYKGRNVSERGSWTGVVAEAPLLTAADLERQLRQFIALDYHRRPHTGLALPGAPEVNISPLEMFDWILATTGRIHVPQHPDLIYQFLPTRWLTPGHAGVEYKNMPYDAAVLDEFRSKIPGRFRDEDAKVPFHYDPRDATRLWFRHPDTDRIHEIPWRNRHLLHAPLTDVVRDEARRRIRARGGPKALTGALIDRQLIEEIGHLAHTRADETWTTTMAASRMRFDQARRDHDEAALAHRLTTPEAPTDLEHGGRHLRLVPPDAMPDRTATNGLAGLFEPWPDYAQEI